MNWRMDHLGFSYAVLCFQLAKVSPYLPGETLRETSISSRDDPRRVRRGDQQWWCLPVFPCAAAAG